MPPPGVSGGQSARRSSAEVGARRHLCAEEEMVRDGRKGAQAAQAAFDKTKFTDLGMGRRIPVPVKAGILDEKLHHFPGVPVKAGRARLLPPRTIQSLTPPPSTNPHPSKHTYYVPKLWDQNHFSTVVFHHALPRRSSRSPSPNSNPRSPKNRSYRRIRSYRRKNLLHPPRPSPGHIIRRPSHKTSTDIALLLLPYGT